MKKLTLMLCAASTALLFACNNETKGDASGKDSGDVKKETAKDEPWVPVDSAKAMQDMMAAGTPGPMHTMMASWNGTWNGETTMWNYDGDPNPQKSAGQATNTMILGGKYQSSKHTGTMMGMPFEGQALMGYDNVTKEFISTWADVWGTGIMVFHGSWDDASKTLTMTGSAADPSRPGKTCTMREAIKVIDDNTQHMEMYGPDPKTGKEYKMFEIHMTKKK